jgi:hypothetical protein
MTTVGLEPQWYTTWSLFEAYHNLFTLFFSLACIIKTQPFSNKKMTFVQLCPTLK